MANRRNFWQTRQEGTVIASAKVTAVEKEAEHWCQLAQLDWSGKPPVVPFALNLDPAIPMGVIAPQELPEKGLPTSEPPTTESPDFHLTTTGTTITVQSWPGVFVPPQYEVLVRCFVNGQRFQPPMPKQWKGSAASFGERRLNGPYSLDLRIKPEALGAKSTDKLEVQLLFCPAGVRTVELEAGMSLGVGTRMLLSNRVALPWYKTPVQPEP